MLPKPKPAVFPNEQYVNSSFPPLVSLKPGTNTSIAENKEPLQRTSGSFEFTFCVRLRCNLEAFFPLSLPQKKSVNLPYLGTQKDWSGVDIHWNHIGE